MSRPATFLLLSDRDRQMALRFVERCPIGQQVKISKPGRTNEQNSRLHALLTDIAEQLPWPKDSGELHDLEYWKRACTLTWLHETNEHPEIITTLDGNHIGLFVPRTSELDVEKCSSLIEWLYAFGSSNGVAFKEREQPPDEAYTRK